MNKIEIVDDKKFIPVKILDKILDKTIDKIISDELKNMDKFISNKLFSDVIHLISNEFIFVGFNTKTFLNFFATVDEKSDASNWYFTGKIIFRKNNFKEIKRSKKGSGEYIGINCYIPNDGCCFVKCVNYVLNKD